MLKILDTLPPGLLDAEAEQLYEVLEGPTLIHLNGRRSPPLFITTLLHGNEDSGWQAVKSLLRSYQDKELPRALSLFIGNVEAARYRRRHLDGQPDYNRIWCGDGTPEHAMMRQVTEQMQQRGVFASIDIHNNTGCNPHYACVNRLDDEFLQMASLFGRTVVYFIKPESVQSNAFAEFCPAVTLECGQPGMAQGTEHARIYLEACLHLAKIPDHPVAVQDIDLFHSVARVMVPESLSFSFGDAGADLHFIEDLDQLNFSELPVSTTLGWINNSGAQLMVRDEQDKECSDRYFTYHNNEIRTAVPVMPSMLTLDSEVIRQDCLGYLMERLELPSVRQAATD